MFIISSAKIAPHRNQSFINANVYSFSSFQTNLWVFICPYTKSKSLPWIDFHFSTSGYQLYKSIPSVLMLRKSTPKNSDIWFNPKFCTVSHVAWHSLDCGPQNESPSFHRLEDHDFRFSNWLNGFHDHINSEVRSHRTRLFCLFNSCIASVQIYRMETTTFTHIASDRIFNLERKRENWCAITAIDR